MAVEESQVPVEVTSPNINSTQIEGDDASSSQKELTENNIENFALTAEMLFSLHGLDITLPVSCDFCSEKFDDMDLFDSHMVTHKEARTFSCQLCNNTYLSWGNLVAHRKACHRGEILNCDACGQRRFHPGLGPVNFPVGDKPIGCEECGEGFTTIMQLYRHHRIHGAHQLPAKYKLTKLNNIDSDCKVISVFSVLEENKPELKDKGKKSKGSSGNGFKIETLPSGEKRFKKLKGSSVNENNIAILPSGEKRFKKSKGSSVNESNVVILPSGEKRYKCFWCPKTFTANKGLKQHIYKHPAKEDYRCDCGQVFCVFEDMSSHVRTEHVDCNLTCNICYKRLKAGDEFLAHYRNCHSAREHQMASMRISNVTCPICDKVFSQPSALHRHRRLHNPLSCRHVCEKCGDVISCRSKILEHAREHYGDELPELYKQFEQIIVKRKKDKEKKSFICEYCGREFSEKLNLMSHVRRHTGDRPYSCQLCGKAFYTKQQLAIHVRRHTGERPYTCGICPKAFTGPTARHAHRKLHDKVKRYLCPHCGKRFFWKSTFMGHVRLHTGERPYKCNICSKGFTLKGKLNLHLKKHLPEHAIQVCSDCGENFSSEEDLKAHREEQCCMTMVAYVEEGPNGEKDTRIIVMNPEDIEKNNIYIDDSEVVQLVVE